MKILFLLMIIIGYLLPIQSSKAQTITQASDCLMYYQFVLHHIVTDSSSKRSLKKSSKKVAKYIDRKNPKNKNAIIAKSARKIRAQLTRAINKSEKASYNYNYSKTKECNGYKYR